jgi:hypothetical protein
MIFFLVCHGGSTAAGQQSNRQAAAAGQAQCSALCYRGRPDWDRAWNRPRSLPRTAPLRCWAAVPIGGSSGWGFLIDPTALSYRVWRVCVFSRESRTWGMGASSALLSAEMGPDPPLCG